MRSPGKEWRVMKEKGGFFTKEQFEVDERLCFIFNRSFRIFQKKTDALLADYGLTCAQFFVLAKLLKENSESCANIFI